MAINKEVTVTIDDKGAAAGPHNLTIEDVDTGETVVIRWVPIGGTITGITWNPGNIDPPSSPTKEPESEVWRLSYPAPTTVLDWGYTIAATPLESLKKHINKDPEINNVKP